MRDRLHAYMHSHVTRVSLITCENGQFGDFARDIAARVQSVCINQKSRERAVYNCNIPSMVRLARRVEYVCASSKLSLGIVIRVACVCVCVLLMVDWLFGRLVGYGRFPQYILVYRLRVQISISMYVFARYFSLLREQIFLPRIYHR